MKVIRQEDLPPLSPTGNPEEWLGVCPECGKEKFYANLGKRTGYCFRCAEGYRWGSRKTFNDYGTARKILASVWRPLGGGRAAQCGGRSSRDLDPLARAYLSRRGYLDLAGELGIFSHRVRGATALVFPSSEDQGHSYERRITHPRERGTDYLPPGEKGAWVIRHDPPQGVLVLCEGVFDAMAIYRVGFDAGAIHGQQVNWTALPSGVDLLVCLDQDAKERAEEVVLEALACGRRALSVSHELSQKDPDESDPAELLRILRSGVQRLSAAHKVRLRSQLGALRGRRSKTGIPPPDRRSSRQG